MHQHQRTMTLLIGTGVFILAFAYFLFLQSSPFFPDPDSFYHIKMAQLLGEQGVLTAFPWLTYTTLAAAFTDQHFLYHALLWPFVTWLAPFFGAKLATVTINAALFTLVAVFLFRRRIRLWPVYVAILLVTNPFLFRINLVKAPGLSIILLITGLWLLLARRPWWLLVLGFVYVWMYGGFAVLLVFAGVYGVVGTIHEWRRQHLLERILRRIVPHRWHWQQLWRSPYLRLFVAALVGVGLGLVLNPFFPNNLQFYWEQLVQIGIINFQKVVNVGGEWRPYGFVELVANTVFVSIAVLTALVGVLLYHHRQSTESWALLFLTAFFFLITLKSRRYVELYVPFATLFAAFAHRDALAGTSFRALWHRLRTHARWHPLVFMAIALYIIAASLTVVIRDSAQLNRDLKNGFRITYLAGVSAWLAANTPENAIVVHSDWDEFPMLFYHNTRNRYIVGLDPTFMYRYDRALHLRWANLTSGSNTGEATQIIVNDLKSDTVVATKDHDAFLRTMRQQTAFRQVYEDDDAVIFRLVPQEPPQL